VNLDGVSANGESPVDHRSCFFLWIGDPETSGRKRHHYATEEGGSSGLNINGSVSVYLPG